MAVVRGFERYMEKMCYENGMRQIAYAVDVALISLESIGINCRDLLSNKVHLVKVP